MDSIASLTMATGGHTSPCCLLIAQHDHFALQFLWWKMLWNPPMDIKSHTCKNIISRYVLWASVGFVKASKIFFRATISPVLLSTLFHTMPYACNDSKQLPASICYAAQLMNHLAYVINAWLSFSVLLLDCAVCATHPLPNPSPDVILGCDVHLYIRTHLEQHTKSACTVLTVSACVKSLLIF